jgi:hypothetical protein
LPSKVFIFHIVRPSFLPSLSWIYIYIYICMDIRWPPNTSQNVSEWFF